MFYNTNFDVKYHQIESELKEKHHQSVKNLNQEEYYSIGNIELICSKLYHDELCSVFYADNVYDDKIDIGINNLIQKMKENQDFSNMIKDIKSVLFENIEEIYNHDDDYIIFLSLLSYNSFYLMHKIICQVISNNNVSHNLLDELKLLVIQQLNSYES